MEKYKDKYRIPSARHRYHDYSEGTYFVTICTQEKKHYFGEVIDKEVQLSKLGRYAEYCLQQIPVKNQQVLLHSYIVMPNHVHLVIHLDRPVETSQCGVLDNDKKIPLSANIQMETPHCDVSTKMKNIANSCGRLSHIISQFKSAVTRFAKEEQIPFCWQARFHDHIIKDFKRFEKIMNYVITNDEHWEKDCFNEP